MASAGAFGVSRTISSILASRRVLSGTSSSRLSARLLAASRRLWVHGNGAPHLSQKAGTRCIGLGSHLLRWKSTIAPRIFSPQCSQVDVVLAPHLSQYSLL